MNVNVLNTDPVSHETDCLIIGHAEGSDHTYVIKKLDELMGGVLHTAIESGDFEGKLNQTAFFYGTNILAQRVLMVGLGKEEDFTLHKLREVSATAMAVLTKLNLSTITTTITPNGFGCDEIGQAIVEGSIQARYKFEEFKTKKEEKVSLETLNLLMKLDKAELSHLKVGAEKGMKITEAIALTRNLINRPGNIATPSYLAEVATRAGKEFGITVDVIDKQGMESLSMGALLAVAQGSIEPPKFIKMQYYGGTNDPIVIVGKGLTFDSGGISLKPGKGMGDMKSDMSGGAVAIGTIVAAASLKLPVNLIALIPATENMPGPSALKPGDVITSMSGQTIEVLNTDAEGRLILADALTYAKRYSPSAVVDIATLTGAVVVALGSHASGLMGNDDSLIQKLILAGKESGEKVWELPLLDEYKKDTESDIADMTNLGSSGGAGTITAAAMLGKFTTEYPWAHLDIAGTAWSKKGASGIGVRLLLKFIEGELN